jgi:hypothetical protein
VVVLLSRPDDGPAISAARSTTTTTRRTTTTREVTTTSQATTTSTSAPPNVLWTPWSPPDGSFTVEFVGTPSVEQGQVDGQVFVKSQSATVLTRSSLYQVGWYDLSSARYASDSAFVLNTLADEYIKNLDLDVDTRKLDYWAGNPSLEFAGITSVGSEELDIQALMIVAGLRVFLFVVGDSDGTSDFEYFRDSFKIH